jgi:3',5'-cyclic AMP phosphodiesterase CpdA
MGTVQLTIDADDRAFADSAAPSDVSSNAPRNVTPNDEFVLAHLSDLHLSSLEGVRPRALLGKRVLGYLSWRMRRRREHRMEVLDALRADLQSERLDHIAVTGDLTHIGLPQEFRQVAAWLEKLGPPEGVTVVPGNHDAYVRESWDDTFAQWAAYMRGDDAGKATECADAFPTLRVRRDVALIGLSTALPSAPFLATGRLGERQLSRLDELLEETGRAGLFRIVLLHHPPARHTVRPRKSLRDGAAFRDVLARRGAELTLHGHAHFSAATYLDGARGRNLAIGVPSASAIGKHVDRYATYHLYGIRRSASGWSLRVAVRTYSLDSGRFVADDGRRLRQALAAAPA